jgi:hypothetical protein
LGSVRQFRWFIGLQPSRGFTMSVIARSGVRGCVRSIFRGRTTWVGLLFLVVWSLFVAGCGGDDTSVTPPPVVDSGPDRKDTGTPDMGMPQPDTGIDRGQVPPDSSDVTTSDGDGGATPDGDGSGRTDGDATPPADRADVGPDVPADRGPDVVVQDVRAEEAGPVVLVSIAVTPPNPSIAKGTSRQFTATGTYSNNTTQDLTATVTWASSVTTVATINAAGLATSPNTGTTGTTTISATSGTISGSTVLTVTQAVLVSIAVTPTNPSIADGTTQQFAATGTYSDATTQTVTNQATWTSSVTTVATVNGSGLASSQGTGTSTITASIGAVSGNTTLTVTTAVLVSISVTPANSQIAPTTTTQFKATGIYSNGSTQDLTTTATWGSSNGAAATVSDTAGSKGLATGVAQGTTTISAAFTTPSGTITGSTTLNVSNATLVSITVTPTNPSIALGTKQQFQATGTFSDATSQNLTQTVTWNSVTTATATISNAAGSKGEATSVAVGTTTIEASQASITGSTLLTVTAAALQSIAITPISPTIAKGTQQQFTAIGTYSDTTTQDLTTVANWSSDTPSVGTISNAPGSEGLATGVAVGATTITVTHQGISSAGVLYVTAAVLQSIAVTPTNPSIAKGTSRQFAATGTYSDATTQDLTTSVAWESSDTNVATVSSSVGSDGLATSVNTGTTTIKATLGAISGTTTLTVTAAVLSTISVTPANQSIAKGTTLQMLATGIFTDNSTQDLTTVVTWGSATGSVASISNTGGSQGLATGLNPGSSIISATSGAISGATTLFVTPATLSSIAVSPTNPSIAKGTTRSFTATGTYSDSSTQDLTDAATWASSDGTKASVSNAPGTKGIATGIGVGTSTISATVGAVSGNTVLTVTAATLQTIAVTPVNPSIAKGTTVQFHATGTYSDGTVQDLTTSATWNSTVPAHATISNAAGSEGLATSVDVGPTTITATSGAIVGSTSLTVTAATLVSIAVAPVDPSIANGTTQQFTATGTYTDATTQILTTQVTWTSTNAGVAVVVPSGPARGLATATGVGTTSIRATLGSVTGSTTLTVTNAVLTSIVVSPDPVSIANGTKVQFTATGHYSDGSQQNLTTSATWASTDTGVATISNAAGTEGEATSVAPGPTTITATVGAISGNAALTVTSATLTSIDVIPMNRNVAVGTKLQYSATGHFTGGSTQDLSTQVAWSTTNTAVAIISNTAPKGEATAVGAGGPIKIRATLNAIVGETDLTVTGP